MIKINYPQNREEFHKNYIKALGVNSDKRKKFYKLMNNTSLKRFGVNSLDYILLAPFEKLMSILDLSALTSRETKALKLFFNYDAKSKNKFQPKIKTFFEHHLEIKTCYFCNIDFVNAFQSDKSEESNKKYSHFTLDHVVDKATHPLLALSLYNFVPSCYSCNSKFKGSNPIVKDENSSYLSPTSDAFSFERDVRFKTYFNSDTSISKVKTKDDFLLDFSYLKNQKEYENYIDVFKLKGRYIFHKDEIVELIQKKEKYSQSQLEEIANIVGASAQKIKENIFGKELFETNLHKISMCKFKQDIAKDIGLV